jgi:branched-subunit amino acid ABC-type transport system permease component
MISAFISITAFLAGFDRRYLCSTHPRFADNDVLYLDLLLDGGACRLPAVARIYKLAPLISAIGMSIFLQNYVQILQGARQADAADHIKGSRSTKAADPACGSQLLIMLITLALMARFTTVIATIRSAVQRL